MPVRNIRDPQGYDMTRMTAAWVSSLLDVDSYGAIGRGRSAFLQEDAEEPFEDAITDHVKTDFDR